MFWEFKKLLLIVFLLTAASSFATIRYVSKTGSSTPPFLSWETASDSIQKCLNACIDGDTVIVGNGVYREYLKIYSEVTLIGTSMDSTVIDARGLSVPGPWPDTLNTINLYRKAAIKNFHIYGHQQDSPLRFAVITATYNSAIISNSIIESSKDGILLYTGENIVENCIIKVSTVAIGTGSFSALSSFTTRNNLIITDKSNGRGIFSLGIGSNYITGNIILFIKPRPMQDASGPGLYFDFDQGRTEIRNNLIAGFRETSYLGGIALDSVFIINNVLGYTNHTSALRSILHIRTTGDKYVIRNNIICYGIDGMVSKQSSAYADYNLFWNIKKPYGQGIIPGPNNITADPMFVKDTLPTPLLNFDFHLQKYSPAIDAGDPDILDIDGSRSDIGMYGGPLGEKYGYQDLAPRAPRGLTAAADSLNIKIQWMKNTEADFFSYRLYSDTSAGFTADSTTLLSELTDTSFFHTIAHKPYRIYYKAAAVDSQGNQSDLSAEAGVVISSNDDQYLEIIRDYELYQNYPNPFNPSTRIPYRLKEGGFVRIVIYDITGQQVTTLVNRHKEAGYHEEEFNPANHNSRPFNNELDQLVSGIYLYRIEVLGDKNIPVFNSMKKLVLIK